MPEPTRSGATRGRLFRASQSVGDWLDHFTEIPDAEVHQLAECAGAAIDHPHGRRDPIGLEDRNRRSHGSEQ